MESLDHTLTVLAAVLPVLIPVVMVAYRLVLEQLPAARREQAEKTVFHVVDAVEQMYRAIPGSGEMKKAEALRLARAVGVKVSPATLELLIESAVYSMPHESGSGSEAATPEMPPLGSQLGAAPGTPPAGALSED